VSPLPLALFRRCTAVQAGPMVSWGHLLGIGERLASSSLFFACRIRLELVDFDLLNSGLVRMSIGAVQVLTGNMQYFDTASQLIGPEHVMASGALPPGFLPSRSTVSPIGMADWFPIRPSNTCSTPRAKIWSSSRSIFSAPRAACRKRCSISRSGKRRSVIRVAPGSIPISSASCRPFATCGARCHKSFATIPIGNSSQREL
jgi:hypothetical protein